MAQANDSIPVTPGTGATVATHLAAAKEHQVVMVADDDGHIKGTAPAYVAVYRLATEAGASALTFTFVANTDKQWATIYHAATATKTVKVLRVEFSLAATAAGILNFELYRLDGVTAPATGNPAITPRPLNTASAAAEATCLALPTTAGSKVATTTLFSQEINLGANTARTDADPPQPITLWPSADLDQAEIQPLTLRAGVAEGLAVTLRNSAAVVIKGTVRIIFSEV